MSQMLWETPQAEMVIFESPQKKEILEKAWTLKKWHCKSLLGNLLRNTNIETLQE